MSAARAAALATAALFAASTLAAHPATPAAGQAAPPSPASPATPSSGASPDGVAAAAGSTVWRPALYVLGTAERGRGAAYAPPLDSLKRDDAASLALGLDVRHLLQRGRLEASAFGLAHDPASSGDRAFLLAGRARATLEWGDGDWTLRVEDAPRLQRRESVGVSDFQRNELWAEIERSTDGLRLGLRVSDRRRSVRRDRLQGFARQWLSATLGGGAAGGTSYRLEAGPQHYSTDVASGWRLASAFELAGAMQRTRYALRLGWTGSGGGGERTVESNGAAGPATPTYPTPQPPVTVVREPVLDTVAPVAAPQFSPPAQLVGPVLAVDPLDSDEADWDFGRRKLEARLVASRRLPADLFASVELRAQRERGPDLTVIGPEVHVARDRVALRASLRRALGPRLAFLAEGSWQRVRDSRPGFPYSRTIVGLGIELRP